MLTSEQINELHRLHGVEDCSVRRIAPQLHIGRRTLVKYPITPAARPAPRQRASKLDRFKPAIAELPAEDAGTSAVVIAERLRSLGFDDGLTILKKYLHAAPGQLHARQSGPSRLRAPLLPGRVFRFRKGG
jgi:transposase